MKHFLRFAIISWMALPFIEGFASLQGLPKSMSSGLSGPKKILPKNPTPFIFETGTTQHHHQKQQRNDVNYKSSAIMATTTPMSKAPLLVAGFVGSSTKNFISMAITKFRSKELDIQLGVVMLLMALTPYMLGIFFPRILNYFFFLPVYKSEEELQKEGRNISLGRQAEIRWKNLYACLGLILTLMNIVELLLAGRTITDLVRDSLVVWAFFYTAAFLKIRKEARKLNILAGDQYAIQLWHTTVVVVLWIAVGMRPTNWIAMTKEWLSALLPF